MQKPDLPLKLSTNAGDGRPYRSHLQPACLECRKRKTRCRTNTGSAACILCQTRSTPCTFPQPGRQMSSTNVRTSASSNMLQPSESVPDIETQAHTSFLGGSARKSFSVSQDLDRFQNGPLNDSMGVLNEALDESPHVVGPALDADDDELENYLYAGSERNRRIIHPAMSSGAAKQNTRPVVFTTVHRRPVGTVPNQTFAASKCEIIEKLIEPHTQPLIDIFFEKVNPCFPVFSKTSFLRIYRSMRGNISPAVLSNLYANSLVYWNCSGKLASSPCPDKMFVWLQANEALNSESFLSPGLSTILAMILNIGGRPSTSVFGNGSTIGTAVARANALGLNRDPTDWDITETERLFRVRIWWLLVIQDRWWSFAYGLPLQINRKQFDVPIPTAVQLGKVDNLLEQDSGTTVFVSLIHLTMVLSNMLEHIYDVAGQAANLTVGLSDAFEHSLNCWEDSQSDVIRKIIFRGTNLVLPGAANLRLAYLSVKFLLKRLQVGLCIRSDDERTNSNKLMQAHRCAEDIVYFVQEINEDLTKAFWLPMHAYSLTSATAFLLRGALSHDAVNQGIRKRIVVDMINALRLLKSKYSWDLADHCLSMYGNVTEKLAIVKPQSTTLPITEFDNLPDLQMTELEDLFVGLDEYMQTDLEDFLQTYSFQPNDNT